jgi:hypothetical protein
MDDEEAYLQFVFHRLKGILDTTENTLGLRVNETETGIESVTLYGDVLVIHIEYEPHTFTLTGSTHTEEDINKTANSVHEVAEQIKPYIH